MASSPRRRVGVVVLAVLLGLPAARSPVSAQEDGPGRRVTVPIRQVAGGNVYLDLGSDHGVMAGDTLGVAADPTGPVVGRLTVVASTASRSVLAFAGPPFPATRGAPITLLLTRPGRAAPPGVGGRERGGPGSDPDRPPDVRERRARRDSPGAVGPGAPHGRVSLEMSALHSVTTFGGADPETVDRAYATPTVRVHLTVPDAVGGFDLRGGARVAYRYADGGFPADPFSGRVYTASLERTFTSLPLRLGVGRFAGPTESFSGYWDGVHLRLGGRSLGVTALVGFQPDLWNEGFSTGLPKAGLVLDGRRSGGAWRWTGDLSAQTVRPRDEGIAPHTYLGLDQSLRTGPLRLDQELRLDRDVDGRWRVGRFRLRGSVRLAPTVDLRAGASRRRSWILGPLDDPLGGARDRASVGLSVRPGRGMLAVDLSATRREGGGDSRGVTVSTSSGPLAVLGGAEVGTGGSWWDGDGGHALAVSPFLLVRAGDARLRVGYRVYRTDYLDRASTRHGVDGGVRFSLGDGWWADGRLYVRFGDGLRSEGLRLGLARSF